MKVLVCGAGVIGQIYGGRLAEAGHTVTFLARGRSAEALAARGVSLRGASPDGGPASGASGESCDVRPEVVLEIARDAAYDVVLVTVRRDQVGGILPVVAELTAGRIVFLLNLPADLESVRRQVGADRTVFAFPGVGGHRCEDGTVRYLEVARQKTTVGRQGGLEKSVIGLLRSARFAVGVSDDIAGWMKTHTVFITTVGAAILAYGGDSVALAADRTEVGRMVAAVREGFHALARQGVAVTPTPLRLIFTVVPRLIAVGYWQRQLRGPVGTVTIAPHMRGSRETEFPLLRADVRRLVDGHGPTPHLDRLLDAVS